MEEKQAVRCRRDLEKAKINLAKVVFGLHVVAYLVINGIFFTINLLTTMERPWFLWSVLGLGIGVMCHGIAVYGRQPEMPSMAEIQARREERESE